MGARRSPASRVRLLTATLSVSVAGWLTACHEIAEVSPNPAPPGAEVSILGSGFGSQQGAATVRYDGEELPIASWSNRQIVATLPASKPDGTYELTVRRAQDAASAPHRINGALAGMVLVPEGAFLMGSNLGSDESPVHSVHLDEFHIDRTEVTVAAFGACVEARGCSYSPVTTDPFCNWGVTGREDHPMNCVTRSHAVSYCEWAGKRLPTEAEWEKAARGTDERRYPWGDEEATCEYATMSLPGIGGNGCGAGTTAPVGSKPLGGSPYGVQDMAGSVWEWVSDWYGATYYEESPPSNPQGPETGTVRMIRGGSYVNDAELVRSAKRFILAAHQQRNGVGFRCVLADP